MSQINLQVPIDTDIRNQALASAKSLGFSSLQDTIRIFIHQLAKNNFDVSFESKPTLLSTKNEKRYSKMIDDLKNKKEKPLSFKNSKDMFNYLNDPNRSSS